VVILAIFLGPRGTSPLRYELTVLLANETTLIKVNYRIDAEHYSKASEPVKDLLAL
jgi:hypothetical protein